MKPTFALLRRAVRAHKTRSHREKWLTAVLFLRSRDKWILDKRVSVSKDKAA